MPENLTAYQLETPMPDLRPTAAAILDAGLRWLYETEQPDGALTQHHGAMLHADGNRTYWFVPVRARQRPVVVVDVTRVEWIDNGPNDLKTAANPLESGELEALAAELARRGFEVETTWNGHPGTTGSVGLARTAHPSLTAAVSRYKAGCTEHPARSVFCDCGWYAVGNTLIVPPTLVALPAP